MAAFRRFKAEAYKLRAKKKLQYCFYGCTSVSLTLEVPSLKRFKTALPDLHEYIFLFILQEFIIYKLRRQILKLLLYV